MVLISGSGTNLQALLDAAASRQYPATVVAVGSDRTEIAGLARAEDADIPTFVVDPSVYSDRAQWDAELAVASPHTTLIGSSALGSCASSALKYSPNSRIGL